MHYRRLGRTNLNVSVVGIGTTQLRRVPEREAIATLKKAFERGINLVNTGPDYEGADTLIQLALQETEVKQQIYLSVQCGGNVTEFERVFEQTCEKFDTDCIDLFGVAAISEQEAFGHNIWGTGGAVEFLQAKKEEGRIRGIFASDHGSPEHMKELLERDVFDVLMLAYNPLGFHLITFRPETVWQLEKPPLPLQKNYEWENIPRTGREILPLAKQKDVGVMLMKPLAGGLLCSGKAFPQHAWREGLPQPLSAKEVLRYLLMDDAVNCVVTGMASIEEVEENADAGTGQITLTAKQVAAVEASVVQMAKVLCSRCGECDDLCSKGLPISFLFRAAYHYLYPSAPFELSSNLQYFHLHPWQESACESCDNQTCRCPSGIDIPGELGAIHHKMIELRERGLVPTGDENAANWVSDHPYAFKVLSQEMPSVLVLGQPATVRLHLRNIGTQTWYPMDENGHKAVVLLIEVEDRHIQTIRLRQTVFPRGSCHFALTLDSFHEPGSHTLIMRLGTESSPTLQDEAPMIIRTTVRVMNSLQGLGTTDSNSIPLTAQDKSFKRERLIETLLKENEELKYQYQKIAEQKQAINDSIQHLEQELAYLSTGKAAVRQLLKKTLHKLGLFDWFYRHYERVVPVYNFLLRDTWTPATIQSSKAAPTQPSPSERNSECVPVKVPLEPKLPKPSLHKRASEPTAANTLAVEIQQRSPIVAASAQYIEHNIPSEGLTGSWCIWRVVVKNTGSAVWQSASAGLGVFLEEQLVTIARFTDEIVQTGDHTTVVIPIQLPETAGTHRIKLDVTLDVTLGEQSWFSQSGVPVLEVIIHLTKHQSNKTEALMAVAQKRDNWFFSPSQGIHHSQGKPTYPLFVESGKGAILTDVEGRQFVDLQMGWGCSLLGYTHDQVQSAITAALTSPPLPSLTHRLEIEVAEELCHYFPWGDEVLFGKNGSDVTTWAARTARIATGRKIILYVGYHGWQDWNAAVRGFTTTGIPSDQHYAIPLPYLDQEALEAAVTTYANDLAAIMIEPAATAVHLEDTHHTGDGFYLKRAEELAHRHNALFILDEIMTGFRFRGGSAQKDYGLLPDLTCLGKALANGMPLSALVGRRGMLSHNISRIFYAPTNKGEVYSYAAALAALRIYRTETVPEAVWRIGERLRQAVNQICRDLELDAGLVGPPYRMYFGFFNQLEQQDTFCRTLLQQELARHGVISHKGYVLPSIAHDKLAINWCVSGFKAALSTLREAITSGASIQYLDIFDVVGEKRMASNVSTSKSEAAADELACKQEKHFPQADSASCDDVTSTEVEVRAKLKQEILERRTVLESRPATINIELTGRCNVKPACAFCLGKNLSNYDEPGHLKNDLLEHYWQYLSQSQRVNDCSYGEPLLFPRFEEVIERLSAQGIRFGFTTNGLLLTPERSRFLINHAHSVEFVVSLNAATTETYYKLHGQKFGHVLSNLQYFVKCHKDHHPGIKLPVILSFIVMRTNYAEVITFLRLAQQLTIKRVMLRHLFDIGAGEYQVNNFGHEFVYEDERLLYTDYKALENEIRGSSEFDSLEIDFQWNTETSFVAEQAETGSDISCLFPWKFLCIRPLHNMYTPCVFLKKSIASPSNTNLEEVWNGETMVEMRKALSQGEIPGFCKAYGDCCPIVMEKTRQS